MNNRSEECFDTLESLQSLEALLEETFKICERVLSQPIEHFPAQDAWNEDIEADNHFLSEKIQKLEEKFQHGERVYNDCFIMNKESK